MEINNLNANDYSVFDVIVIGGGLIGSCTAYTTSKLGQKTLLLEQFDFLHHRGSSHGESRTIRATYSEPYYFPMVLESYSLWEQAQAEIGYRVHHKTSQLDVGPSSDPALRALIQNLEHSTPSIEFRVLNSSQVKEEFGGKFVVPEDWVAVISELGGILKPTKAVSMFQALAIKNGAVLRDNIEVCQIERSAGETGDGSVVVRAANGREFYGRKCVVAAGAWTKRLIESVAEVKVPIQPVETTICYWRLKEGCEDVDHYTLQSGFPSFASYGHPYVYGTPCLEFPGLIKVALHEGCPCDPDKRKWCLNTADSMDSLKQWIQERFGGRVESDRTAATQSCMYSVTPDEDYVIDFLGGEFGKDVVIAGGFSGHGFKMGPVIGRILADLVMKGVAERVNLNYFKLARFETNPMGNVKHFSNAIVIPLD